MSKISKNQPKVAQKRHKCPKCPKCPKCGKYYVGYPALSREYNKTEICPECGVKEALLILRKRNVIHFSGFTIDEIIQFVIDFNDEHY